MATAEACECGDSPSGFARSVVRKSVSALLARSTRTAGTTGAMICFVRAGVAHPEHHFGYAVHILRRY